MVVPPSLDEATKQRRKRQQQRLRTRRIYSSPQRLQQLLISWFVLVYVIQSPLSGYTNNNYSYNYGGVDAFCLPDWLKEQHADQSDFYKCTTRMANADQNRDDELDWKEYKLYLQLMEWSLYVVAPDKLLNRTIHDLFDTLVQVTGNQIDENGQPVIDIFGADVEELPEVDDKRKEKLHEICDYTIAAFKKDMEPETEPPKLMVLSNVVNKNKPSNGGTSEMENDPDVLSIHSSFVIANFQKLEADDVDIDSAAIDKNSSSLHLAYVNFLDNLMAVVCPNDGEIYAECLDNPQFEYNSAYDPLTGQLCGSHAEYVRRVFCGENYETRRRRQYRELLLDDEDLEPDHEIENVVLYRVQDSLCPVPMNHQGEGGGHAPRCQTVYAHYLLHLHDLDVGHKNEIEEVYVNITQAAINHGMLEDSLREIDPNSAFVIEGAGEHISPNANKHRSFPHTRRRRRRRQLTDPCTRRLNQPIATEDSSISNSNPSLISDEGNQDRNVPREDIISVSLLKGPLISSTAPSNSILNGLVLGVILPLCVFLLI